MTQKEFFQILKGQPPVEVEFEIELKCREINELPDLVIKQHCFDLVKQVKMQDMVLISALMHISETEALLYKYETELRRYRKQTKPNLFNTLRQKIFGNTHKK